MKMMTPHRGREAGHTPRREAVSPLGSLKTVRGAVYTPAAGAACGALLLLVELFEGHLGVGGRGSTNGRN